MTERSKPVFPHMGGAHRMRERAVRGLGTHNAEQLQVAQLFVTRPEGERPAPHVMDVGDVTHGLGVPDAQRAVIERLVLDTNATYQTKGNTQRIVHARGRLVEALRAMDPHIPSDIRQELTRRAIAFWERTQNTELTKPPTHRYVVQKSEGSTMLGIPRTLDVEGRRVVDEWFPLRKSQDATFDPISALEDLIKAKYIKRIATGDPKRPWRYVYRKDIERQRRADAWEEVKAAARRDGHRTHGERGERVLHFGDHVAALPLETLQLAYEYVESKFGKRLQRHLKDLIAHKKHELGHAGGQPHPDAMREQAEHTTYERTFAGRDAVQRFHEITRPLWRDESHPQKTIEAFRRQVHEQVDQLIAAGDKEAAKEFAQAAGKSMKTMREYAAETSNTIGAEKMRAAAGAIYDAGKRLVEFFTRRHEEPTPPAPQPTPPAPQQILNRDVPPAETHLAPQPDPTPQATEGTVATTEPKPQQTSVQRLHDFVRAAAQSEETHPQQTVETFRAAMTTEVDKLIADGDKTSAKAFAQEASFMMEALRGGAVQTHSSVKAAKFRAMVDVIYAAGRRLMQHFAPEPAPVAPEPAVHVPHDEHSVLTWLRRQRNQWVMRDGLDGSKQIRDAGRFDTPIVASGATWDEVAQKIGVPPRAAPVPAEAPAEAGQGSARERFGDRVEQALERSGAAHETVAEFRAHVDAQLAAIFASGDVAAIKDLANGVRAAFSTLRMASDGNVPPEKLAAIEGMNGVVRDAHQRITEFLRNRHRGGGAAIPSPAPEPAPEQAFAPPTHTMVGGDTYPHRQTIKLHGGKWDPDRKQWRVPTEHVERLKTALRREHAHDPAAGTLHIGRAPAPTPAIPVVAPEPVAPAPEPAPVPVPAVPVAPPPPPAPTPVVSIEPPGGWTEADRVGQSPEMREKIERVRQQMREARERKEAARERHRRMTFQVGQVVTVDGKPWKVEDVRVSHDRRTLRLGPMGRASVPRLLDIFSSGGAALYGTSSGTKWVDDISGGTLQDDPVALPPRPVPTPRPPPAALPPQDAQPPPGTSRAEAAAETKRLEESGEYVNDRASKIEQRGEDVMGSARHRAAEWKSLREALVSKDADKMFTRDFLLRQEPIDLIAHAQRAESEGRSDDTLTHLLLHLSVRKFGGTPTILQPRRGQQVTYDGRRLKVIYTDVSSDAEVVSDEEHTKRQRESYYDAYVALKAIIERHASGGKRVEAVADLVRHEVRDLIDRFRSERGQYDAGANALIDVYNTLNFGMMVSSRLGKKTSAVRQLADFSARLRAKYPDPADQKAHVAEHAMQIMEGKSMNAAFGTVAKKDKPAIDLTALLDTSKMRRTGPPSEHKSVDGSLDMLDKKRGGKYSMRGVQWGKSVTDEEREHHLKSLVDSFADLTDVLGLPPEMASYNGRLAIAIGARGTAGAVAHYEPALMVINLTRKKGAGSLAHEWGHFFDYVAGVLEGGGATLPPGSFELKRKKKKSATRGEALPIGQLTHSAGIPREGTVRRAMWDLTQGRGWHKFKERLGAVLSNMGADGDTVAYYQSVDEMWARTFERYVQYKLRKAGRENTYLTARSKRLLAPDENPWPTDDEIAEMEPAIDKIFAAFRSSELIRKSLRALLVIPLEKALNPESRAPGATGPGVHTQAMPDFRIYQAPEAKGTQREEAESAQNRMDVARDKARGFWGTPPREPTIHYDIERGQKRPRLGVSRPFAVAPKLDRAGPDDDDDEDDDDRDSRKARRSRKIPRRTQ